MMPPAKFSTVPLSAMPIATPAAAIRAAMEVVSTPRVLMDMMISRMVRPIVVKLIMKEARAFSVLRFANMLPRAFFIRRISHAPTR